MKSFLLKVKETITTMFVKYPKVVVVGMLLGASTGAVVSGQPQVAALLLFAAFVGIALDIWFQVMMMAQYVEHTFDLLFQLVKVFDNISTILNASNKKEPAQKSVKEQPEA